jgi:protein-export membrane protein SecD
MNLNRRILIKFSLVIFLALVCGLISYPQAVSKIPPVYDTLNKLKINLGLDLQGGIHLEYAADVSQIEKDRIGDAMQGVQDVIERRVNAFGVAEPVIYTTRSGNEQRLVVELAGIKDIEQAKELIRETPFLEFKEEVGDGSGAGRGGDLGFVKKGTFVPEFDAVLFGSDLADGNVHPQLVETQFGWHIIKKVETRGAGDALEIHAAHILLAKQGGEQTEGLPQDMVDDVNNQNKIKAEDVLKRALAGEDFAALANENSQDPGNQPQPEFSSTGLTGKNLKDAAVVFQSQGMAEPQVSLKFDEEGTKLFSEITKKNLNKRVAIFLDGQIISAPTVQSEITNGEAVITGNFTIEEAKKLAQRLNEGALPIPINLISQQSVEASLGQESLVKSLKAGAIGLVVVMLFMIVYYRYLGLVASLSLLLYSALMISIFKFSTVTPWSFTFTLSGIAGFILSIGMAVDANVLIFERTKEEIRNGRSTINAIEEGFRRAWPSIRDGNYSTILTSIILIGVGTGFVKGFAISLVVGVFISMFSAIVVVRTILRFTIRTWAEKWPWLISGAKKNDAIHK